MDATSFGAPGRGVGWLLPAMALAFAAGIVFVDRSGPVPGIACMLPCAPLALAACFTRRVPVCLPTAIVVALAGGAGAQALSARLVEAARDRPAAPFEARLRGSVCRKRVWPGGVELELCGVGRVRSRLLALPPGEPTPVPRRLVLSAPAGTPEQDWLASLLPGEDVAARLRVEALVGARNPGASDRARDLARRGISARARLVDHRLAVRIEDPSGGLGLHWQRARHGLADRLAAAGPGGALLAALALGDRRALAPEDTEAFRRLGIGHLLAVSGLHLGILGGLGFAALRGLALRLGVAATGRDVRSGAVAGALALCLAYALLVGWGPPVQRAWVFGLGVGLGWWARRGRAPANVLAGAFLVVAAGSPDVVFDLGAQLSFGATAALLLGAGRPSPVREGTGPRSWLSARLGGSLRVSATAIAATSPVLAAHGLPSTPVGLACNVLAVPLTAFPMLPASLVAAVVASFCDRPGSLAPFEWIARAALALAARAADGLPPVETAGPVALPGLLVAVVLALGCVRARRTGLRVLLCLGACVAASAAPRESAGPPPPRVVAFDVGQGDALLVEGRAAAVLVDAGWAWAGGDHGRSVVVPALRALGVARLDLLVATHADADHRGGLASVVEAIPVGEVWLPRGAGGEFPRLRAVAARLGVRVRERGRGDAAWKRGDVVVEPLWPPAGLRARTSRNHASLVVRFRVADLRVLAAADIDTAAEEALLSHPGRVRAEILKVAHHGSASGSSDAFLAAVDPELALVSAPCGSRARLPSPRALERLSDRAGSVWWTGRDGAVLVTAGRSSWGEMTTVAWAWQRLPDCRGP